MVRFGTCLLVLLWGFFALPAGTLAAIRSNPTALNGPSGETTDTTTDPGDLTPGRSSPVTPEFSNRTARNMPAVVATSRHRGGCPQHSYLISPPIHAPPHSTP